MATEESVGSPVQGRPKKPSGVWSFLKELPVLLGMALVIALLIKVFLVQAFFIPSESMVPTLEVRDRVLVSKLTYRFHDPRRGDVIVFHDPYGRPGCVGPPGGACVKPGAGKRVYDWFAELFGLPTGETRDYIKRIVGLPGETIELRDGTPYINGKLTTFPHTATSGPQNDHYTMAPYKIGSHAYWVMGDNRGNSSDSRVFKTIDREKIIGRAFVLLWPPNRFTGL